MLFIDCHVRQEHISDQLFHNCSDHDDLAVVCPFATHCGVRERDTLHGKQIGGRKVKDMEVSYHCVILHAAV